MFRANQTYRAGAAPGGIPRPSLGLHSDESEEWAHPAYAQTLSRARDALRAGELSEAEHALMQAGTIAGDDPAFCNLVGLLHESCGRRKDARKSYGKAIRINRRDRAAQQNMRRLYELEAFGHTRLSPALGDEL